MFQKILKMRFRQLLNSTLASIMIAAAPAKADDVNDFFNNSESYKKNLACFIDSLEESIRDLGEPNAELKDLTKHYNRYWLTEEEYAEVRDHVKSGLLKSYEIQPYLGFMALMRHNQMINYMAMHYNLDPMQILEVINQESSFNIRIRGASGERGIGQKMPGTAKALVDRITDPKDELYYPYLDKEDYTFKKLSSDYRLNIILTAAMIRTAHSNLDEALKEQGMTREDLTKKVKEAGKKETFWYLANKKNDKFDYYHITPRMRQKINKFWKENDVEPRDLDYLAYNGGPSAVSNLLMRMSVSEVLQVNFYNYSRRKDDVQYFMSLYNGEIKPATTDASCEDNNCDVE